jgi:hypothetical protein
VLSRGRFFACARFGFALLRFAEFGFMAPLGSELSFFPPLCRGTPLRAELGMKRDGCGDGGAAFSAR